MKILVVNSGSSSIKFQLFSMPAEKVIASGMVERIGLNDSIMSFKTEENEIHFQQSIPNHTLGLQLVSEQLMHKDYGVVNAVEDIDAVGHRVVHGGSRFSDTIQIDEEVKEKIKSLFSLAPLHNPPNLTGIEVAERVFPHAPQIAVFDTAFHQSLPKKVYKYAIPNHFLTENKIRAYGFHGISHKYVSEKAIDFLNNKEAKLITLHLGNGCSMTAIEHGRSIDHSMGFGPNDGLIMGTRSGSIDVAVIFYLIDKLGYQPEEVANLLSKKSGMLGLTGYSDLREIEERAARGCKDCQLALEMNAHRIKKYIGAFVASLNGLDALVFTAGIGENSDILRQLICEDMNAFGIQLDYEKNALRSKTVRNIASPESTVDILVVPTNEELEIAKQSYQLLDTLK